MQTRPSYLASLISTAYNFVIPSDQTILATLPENLGYILEDTKSDIIRIVVTGTKNAKDWMEDSEFKLVKTNFGTVHEGFNNDFKIVNETVKDTLNSITNSKERQYEITGHSLGSPIAIQVTLSILDQFTIPSNTKLVLFACPNPGDATFKNYVQNKLATVEKYSFANEADIVPKVPLGFGYLPAIDHILFNDPYHRKYGLFHIPDVVLNHSIDTYAKNSDNALENHLNNLVK